MLVPRRSQGNTSLNTRNQTPNSRRLLWPEMQLFAPRPKKDTRSETQCSANKSSLKSSKDMGSASSKRTEGGPSCQPSGTLHYTPDLTSFEDLGLAKSLLVSCRALELRHPTRVQFGCIPPILKGRDVVACARTGTGKTGAFALPILSKLSMDPYGNFALVLSPTRELAFQVHWDANFANT